jgi:Ni2+-binding GTPase involved in maturation of urease and hydrogenase
MTAPDNRNDAVQFLYKHGDLTYSAAHAAVEKLSNNGFRIVRADLHDATKAQLAKAVEAMRVFADESRSALPHHAFVTVLISDCDAARAVVDEIEKGWV